MAWRSFGCSLLLLSFLELTANPSDPTVISGRASSTSTPHKLEITAHDKTILSWKEFSIGSQETTHFNLPDSRSVILNRVSSHNLSKIEGLLSSNGIVYLLNPNGILITPTGKIDTAGFLASTLNISDQDFLNGGDLLFTGSGSITNLGAIRCSSGDVILIASQLKNDGLIEAPEGTLALAAAQEVLLSLQGEERLTVRLAASNSPEEIGLHQTGTLKSLQAELKADGNLFAYAIKNEGHINAASTVHRNGRIYLVAEKGVVTSSGTLTAPGGEVRILGQIATLTDQASIDVSHNKGGGTVLIGGDFQGKNPDILNAQMTYVGPDVVISAGALQNGTGGKVIAWADGEMFFYGKIHAPGGPLGGDGGFAEVSGKHNLDFQGLVDLTAPQGETGTLLLDPTNVTFSTAVDAGFIVIPPTCVSGYVFSGTPTTANVNIANLLTNLGTCSVTISTTSGGAGTGTVTVSNPIDWTGTTTNTLSVTSASTLTFSAAITNETSAGTMTWNSGAATAINAALTNGPATGSPSGASLITINSVGSITQAASGADITDNSASGAMIFNATGAATSITFGGTVTSNTTGLMMVTSDTGGISTNAMTFNAGSLTMNSAGAITGSGLISVPNTGSGSLLMTSASYISIGGSGINFNSNGGSLALSGGGVVGGSNAIRLVAPVTFNSTGTFSMIGAANTGGGGISSTAAGPITISGSAQPALIQSIGSSFGISLSGSLTYSGTNTLTLSASNSGSTITVSAVTINSGALTMNAASQIGLNGTVTSNTTGLMTLITGSYIITNSMTFNAGSLTMSSSGGITASGLISFLNTGSGSLSMTSTANPVIIQGSGINFNSNGGSLALSGVVGGSNAISLVAPVTFNSTGTFSMIGAAISSTAAAPITISGSAQPALIQSMGSGVGISLGGSLTYSGTNTLTLKASTSISVAAVTINSGALTMNAASSISFNGLLTNASSFTGTSLFANAGTSISIGTSPAGFTSSSNGASVFVAGTTFSTTDNLSSITTTPPAMGTGGNISITANNNGGTAISILCPVSLGTTGAFSATAELGAAAINGNITTAGGAFTVSAPSGSVTLNGTAGTTSSFAAGSVVNISSKGATLSNSTSTTGMTFAAGAGSLTVSSTGAISIAGPLNYSYTGPCQFLGTGASGSIGNTSAGAMTFFSGCGDATFQSTNTTITFNATPLIQFQSGAGNAFVTTSPATGGNMTIGPFDFESGSGKSATFNSNAALTFGGNFTYGNSSNTCNMTSAGLLTIGPSTFLLNTSPLNMTSTAGGITTLTTGPITVASAAGALNMNAFGTITLGGTLTDNSTTSPLTLTTASTTGDILINAAITTSGNGNVNATAGRSITLSAGNSYTQSTGTGTFVAGNADSAGAFSTSTTSTLATSGSAILSITGAQRAGTAAITIAGPLSPASSGAFSAAATTGNTTITGAITVSGGGAFSASALGPSGTVTLSTATTNSFTGSAVSLSAGTGGVTLSTTNTTFATGAGSLTVNSIGTVAVNTALTYAATGSCQFTSTGGSITNSGILNFNSGSGPISFTAHTIANQAITTGAAITNASANSLTFTSSGTTTFNGSLTNNSTLSTGISLSVTAGEKISFPTAAVGFTSSSPAASNFTANQTALGTFSTAATSFLTTTSTAGAVSITAANATGVAAVSILCPITLASAGAFSATATTGNIVISGTITNTTTGGTFNVSAPGESGAITLSNTINFTPGSAVSLASAGLTTLSGATMTFGGTSGSLAVGTTLAPVGSIAINGTLNYSSTGACNFIASGGITNNASGVMNFNSGSGDVTFESTASTITFNATPAITFNAGAGNVIVKTNTGTGGAITVNSFTFNSGGAKTVTFNSNSTLSFNGPFAYGGSSGTSSMTSTGLLTLNAALGLNAAGTFSMSSTASGLTTTASGPITVAAAAGPLTMNALGTITLGAALINNSTAGSPTLSMTTTGLIGDILLNAAVTTSGSATLSAARNLTFNTGIGYTQSAGTGTFLAGQAAEGLFSISSLLQTSGSGSLSITSSNAPASNAITMGALTLASAGAFSATATQGNVFISGNISSTASAPFSVSASGTAGAINMSGTTASFTPGSAVSLTAAGSTTLSSTSTFGNGGTGSLTISGNTAGVTLSGPLTYDTTGAFSISSSGSTITTTVAAPLTITAGSGTTLTANGLITLGGTVLYNSSDVNGFSATSTTGGITITAPVTVSTAAPLALSATTAGQQVLIQGQVTNSSTGNITVTTSNLTLEPVTGSTTSAELGTLSGTLALTNVTQVALMGGTASGAFAQLGYNTGSPTSNITFTNCHSLLLQPGTATNCYTLVGHGSPTAGALTLVGNITIAGTGNLIMGSSGNGTNCFAQIGHVQSLANNTSATGTVSVILGGSISLRGGNNTNAYALIGHGGVNTTGTNSYTGDVTVQAGGTIVLETSSSGVQPAFAAIGPTSISSGTVTITGGHTISATSTGGSIVLQPAANNECVIGAYIRGSGMNIINPLTINVTTAQDLILTGAPNPGTSLNGALIGALAYTGAVPFVAPGTSSTSTLNVTVGRNLEMQTSVGGANTTTFTALQNGLGGAANPLTVNVAGSTTVMGGNNFSTLTSLGALTLNTAGDATLLSDQTAGSLGVASLIGNGNTSISGNGVWLTGYITGPEALVQNTTGNLSVVSNNMTLASNGNIALTGGAGGLTVNALTGDLNLNGLASIQNLGTGPTSMTVGATVSLTAGAGTVMISNNTGTLTMNITDNLNLITNTGGSASITSNGSIAISAENMALFGLGMGEQSLIQATAGNILLMALNDITLDDTALIANTGAGNVTLVVDQQAPLPPQIGTGRFVLNPEAQVTTMGGLLQVFTATPNGITAGNLAFGDLNGRRASETVVCPFDKPTPSDKNVYVTYYDTFATPVGTEGNPYTVYYKTSFIPPVPPPPTPPAPVVPQPVLVRNLSKISFASAQVFWVLREYPVYSLDEAVFFLECTICSKKSRKFCMDVDDRYPYIHQNWTLYPIGL